MRAGLNIGLSGIPWWTTDIGGFFGGEIDTPYFQELIVRWFQYGAFCPLFRLHGWRNSSLAHPETLRPDARRAERSLELSANAPTKSSARFFSCANGCVPTS